MAKFFGKVLVIDTNFKFVESIKEEGKLLSDYPCLFAKTLQDGIVFLKQNTLNIRVVFISNKIGSTQGTEEFSKLKEANPNIPLVLLLHNPERVPRDVEDNNPGYVNIIRGPKKFSSLTDQIDEMFTSKETWTDIEATKEAKEIELQLVDEGYIPIPLDDFIISDTSFFNVFIKLGPSKFIKILNAGDSFQEGLIQNYSQKGIAHFHIPKEEHKKYIRLCEEMTKKDMRNDKAETKQKLRNVINFGANIAQSLSRTGISQESLDIANTFLNQSVSLMKNMKMKSESLKRFIDTIESREHTATVSFIAGMIANEVGIESLKAIKIVGTAALLHDIGLYESNPDFKEEEPDKWTDEDRKIFNEHQIKGGEILRKCGGFDAVIYQAVENHHMRRRGPDPAYRSNNLNMVTEIIGAADELYNIVISQHADEAKIQQFMKKNLKNFSQEIERAVVKILQKKAAA
jgi:putative nucleotidyltransferase with HDIG domain